MYGCRNERFLIFKEEDESDREMMTTDEERVPQGE